MTTSTPTTPIPSHAETTSPLSSRQTLIHNVSLGALIICPIIILLPPRKMDKYTLSLLTGMFLGGNQLSTEYTGISVVQRMQSRMASMSSGLPGAGLPPKALETQRRLREERARKMGEGMHGARDADGGPDSGTGIHDEVAKLREEKAIRDGSAGFGQAGTSNTGLSRIGKGMAEARIADNDGDEEQQRKLDEQQKKDRGLLEKVWMGGEPDDWKAKRDQKEKEALEEGRGYGGLIMDQIYEVWGWGKEKTEEVKEMDEKILAMKKREKAERERESKK